MHKSFYECWQATQNALAGRMQPASRSLPTPALGYVQNSLRNFSNSSFKLYHLLQEPSKSDITEKH